MLRWGGGTSALGRSLKNEAEVARSLSQGLAGRFVLHLQGEGAPREAGDPQD